MNERKPILILTTGGTIDKTYFDALSTYQIADSAAGAVLRAGRVTHPFTIEEVARKDSLELDDGDRVRIVEAVRASDAEWIIITHGTDTMTVTAAALEDVAGKTIVLVGAWTPARFAETDAHFNLGMAFACCQVAAPGVYITMNGTVFRASDVAKDRGLGSFVGTN